ncbi:MAG: paraquat-inducible protein A [Rhodobacterales bacterium]|nr:paraquat-inducible protein A [Rhodobacterales bacterium]
MENALDTRAVTTASAVGLLGCRSCGRVNPMTATECARCGGRIAPRSKASLQVVWAWLAAGLIVYIPANVYPMLLTTTLGKQRESTIVGGVIELVEHGSIGIALIVFVASVVIPIGKFLAIGYLAIILGRPASGRGHRNLHLFEVVEFIGRWSMIDVFVVAILSALVQFDFAATINPGYAAVCFALSVAFTMLSALSFDPRLIWDAEGETQA